MKKILGVIPARWASSRLPGKPLADLCGKPMIQHVYERAKLSDALSGVVVATDDERVLNAVRAFGGEAVMTSLKHPNGSSRAEEAARKYPMTADAVINIQGDEPLLNPMMIDEVAGALAEPEVTCATLCRPLAEEDRTNPNVVKVVMSRTGDALYFSRSLIPYPRHEPSVPLYQHIGIYGYSVDFLRLYVTLPMTPLAEAESLEQLKVLEHGYKIRVKVTACLDPGRGVDTPEDLEFVRGCLRRG
ncbi:MAG: 3-deoxy-manno-octulosonate cytidylyltransferase [Fretibacterium sp.]|nr:3-deoxy-manno-octulosonate cytidylyltransferase [Fretibacterium sp.]